MSRIGPTALSVVLVGVLTLAARTQEAILVAAAVLVVQVLLATAPSPADARGRSIPTPHFAATMGAGLVSSAIALWPDLLVGASGNQVGDDGLVETGVLAGVLPGVAVGLFAALVAQMLRRDDRRDLVVSTAAATTLATFAALASAWIGTVRASSGDDVVAIASAGLVVALVVWVIPIDRYACAALAVVGGAAGSAVAALVVDGLPTWLFGVTVGSAMAVFAILGQVLGRAWSRGRTHASAGWGFPGALAVAVAAPVVYLGGQLVTASF